MTKPSAKRDAFSGDPRTRWLSSGGADRQMELLDEFTYWDPGGRAWAAPAGAVVDGASIPRPLWTIVGSPYTGDYRRGSIVHDVACAANPDWSERKAADRMYYHACRRGGCTRWQAIVQYIGVRIGAWIPNVELWKQYAAADKSLSRFQATAAERSMRGTFYEIAAPLEPRADLLSFDEIDAEVERQLATKREQLALRARPT